MNDSRFQMLVQWGGPVLAVCAIANIYFVLRYREICREAAKVERAFPQQIGALNAQLQALDGLARDFAAKAGQDPQVVEIFRQHGLIGTPKKP